MAIKHYRNNNNKNNNDDNNYSINDNDGNFEL